MGPIGPVEAEIWSVHGFDECYCMDAICEADKWVRLKSPNKQTEELVWYGIEEYMTSALYISYL